MEVVVSRSHIAEPATWLRDPTQLFILTTAVRFSAEERWMIDAYNLLNTAKEVEEFPVTGPTSRLTAAVQPPRAIHVGFRVTF